MNESDIIEVLKLLKSAIKNKDWDEVQEATGYLQEYLDEYDDSDEDY
jgi:hypothetical protein